MKKIIQKRTERTVFITGVTSGIGTQIALKFAANGWNILAHYHSSKASAEGLRKRIQALGKRCDLLHADFSTKGGIECLVKKSQEFNIDSLINNAGTYVAAKHFTDLSLEDIVDTFMVNTFAPILLSAKIFKQMKKKKFGRIVNISSVAAKYGGSSLSMHYGCSKLSLEGITKTLAKDGATFNILANTVRPGVIDTDFHKKFPKDMKHRIDMIPMKRMGRSEEVAELIYYLGSEKNTFITNEVITIAGGE